MNLLILNYNMAIIANPFVDRFNEGGPFIMTLILICLILSIFFVFMGAKNLKQHTGNFKKYISLCAEAGLLALVIGIFGSVIGLIEAFDAIESFDQGVPTDMLASGLKISFLTMVFGTFTFIITRMAIIILKWMRTSHLDNPTAE